MRVAIYARYSSERQRVVSIEDQVRVCQNKVDQERWLTAQVFSDRACSGSTMMRPGIQALLKECQAGCFDILVTESLDRLSRDQEDIAAIYKRLSFANTQIYTLADGQINELNIGLKGTMSALFLKDLADKTRRGMLGSIASGKAAGGISYGYRMLRHIDQQGEIVRGERQIKDDEAKVIRSVFRSYAEGRSGRYITDLLNRNGVSGPRGDVWHHTTVLGNQKRGSGILNNALYVGKLVWNRQRWMTNPYTGCRVSRLNDPALWVVTDVPELRIVQQRLWKAVKARQACA
jgi:DNA invertase Pin-like site-specific DNA recombinase